MTPPRVGLRSQPAQLALSGERLVTTKDGGEILCRPVFAALGDARGEFNPEASAVDHRGSRRRKLDKPRSFSPPIGRSACLCTMAWGNTPMPHRPAGRSRRFTRSWAISIAGRKRGFSQSAGQRGLRKGISAARKWPQQRIGRERKPLGPPAKPGNCAAYDIFTAILEGRPYPVKALINFGSNTIMSTGDSQRAREAFRARRFRRGCGVVHDSDGRAL